MFDTGTLHDAHGITLATGISCTHTHTLLQVLPVSGLKRASKDPPEEQSSGASAASPLPSALLPPLSASLPPPHPTPTPKPAAAPSKDVGGAGRPSVLKKRRLAAPPPQPPAGGPTRQMCVMAVGTRVEVMWRPGGGHYRGRVSRGGWRRLKGGGLQICD